MAGGAWDRTRVSPTPPTVSSYAIRWACHKPARSRPDRILLVNHVRKTTDVTCLACGCLCDDLTVVVDGGAVVEVENACPVGLAWFEAACRSSDAPEAMIEGAATTTREAVERAADLLSRARRPVVFGLTRTVTETVRDAVGLAERLKAVVVLDRVGSEIGKAAAFQRQGRVSATLGEVKNRSDVVVFWGANPVETHPRHWDRYSVGPVGRFVPTGRAGRSVFVIGDEKTATAERADVVVPVDPRDDVATLVALRLLIQGKTVRLEDPQKLALLKTVAARWQGARYGAFFFQSRGAVDDRSGADWEAASRLVRDLNDVTRFVLLGMGGPGNTTGAEAALTWQGGFSQGIDYRLGVPTPLDGLCTLDDLLCSGEPDAVVLVGEGFPEGLSAAALGRLRSIPRIVIGPGATCSIEPRPTVAIATARAGFDAGGTVIRGDGIGLPVRTVAAPIHPSDRDVIHQLIERLKITIGGPS